MRYKIIDVYKLHHIQRYIAKCLKTQSPQFIVIESHQTLCKELDIIDVDLSQSVATWATGEKIALKILHQSDHIEKFYDIEY
ncbi:hypothetical protein PYR74_14935 [Acinetobacter bereziniae]|uniref:Uncharacterized protein n=2 Tax=Acinetobacter bereziniae TaxID=106648 RepID=N9DCH2_ACIBZ|nr:MULTISPECIES: hypothetical protein [Acinetobacter]ATZ64282.1 hypothetical protein BSR55_13355 [Acinetobacter bereziniae]ENV95541.1 hypothetical protein F938_02566 [Acinetobacter bereziniae LMG 1003 = CIP 70.12]MBJ8443524.1 hypothetical protein [Acinetobacter bereziniae]MBJ9372752.1 hypothetical protein [Acinetobacter sp. TGL-Y2]MCU4437256.1 hypothetical protein [Acinetobacter bereziniae]